MVNRHRSPYQYHRRRSAATADRAFATCGGSIVDRCRRNFDATLPTRARTRVGYRATIALFTHRGDSGIPPNGTRRNRFTECRLRGKGGRRGKRSHPGGTVRPEQRFDLDTTGHVPYPRSRSRPRVLAAVRLHRRRGGSPRAAYRGVGIWVPRCPGTRSACPSRVALTSPVPRIRGS